MTATDIAPRAASHDSHSSGMHTVPAAYGHGHDAGHDAGHEEHVEFLEALNPPPSYWPALLAVSVGLLPASALLQIWGDETVVFYGRVLMVLGLIASIIPLMGWCHSVIVDKWVSHFGPVAQGRDLVLGTKLFFLSEIAIFGSIFAYMFGSQLQTLSAHGVWPPETSPHLGLAVPALGLFVLLTSSVTCEVAHKMLAGGSRGGCKTWLLITVLLGLGFLFMQGWEWGWLIYHYGFTVTTDIYGTIFYVLTGFHGFHVITGLIMLLLVYGRLEMGHYSPSRHFSMLAASWYWHLVDVVWIFVFVFMYCNALNMFFEH